MTLNSLFLLHLTSSWYIIYSNTATEWSTASLFHDCARGLHVCCHSLTWRSTILYRPCSSAIEKPLCSPDRALILIFYKIICNMRKAIAEICHHPPWFKESVLVHKFCLTPPCGVPWCNEWKPGSDTNNGITFYSSRLVLLLAMDIFSTFRTRGAADIASTSTEAYVLHSESNILLSECRIFAAQRHNLFRHRI